MKLLFMLFMLLCVLSFTYVDNGRERKQSKNNISTQNIYQLSDSIRDTQYVFTGVYTLANKQQGIKMIKAQSTESYNIAFKPFASVKNILRAFAEKNIIDNHITYGITIVFDNEGTQDLAEGTGNPAAPYIAIVIANKLLYVVENKSKMKTGILNIILVDYTEHEVNTMLDAINKKL